MNGNHDMASVGRSTYARWVGCPRYWTIEDGNLLFISLPAERGNAAALFVPEVEAWMREAVARRREKNLIILAHQLPSNTVDRTERLSRGMFPRDAVERFLKDFHVDLWLGGHIHSGRRSKAASAVRNGTVFINVASVSHTYGTEICNSFVLEIEEGAAALQALCRDHDHRTWIEDQHVEVPLSRKALLSDDGPVFESYEFDVPTFYRGIHDEEVTDFAQYR
jgi:hypothetical protein